MRVLLLSNNWEVAEPVREFLVQRETVVCAEYQDERKPPVDIIVSYCYGHLLKGKALQVPAVNLHNSYLPWGRGAQPLFFSVINGEPCGVSVHWIDEGLDTGPLIARRKVLLTDDMTFRDAYKAQHRVLTQLFTEHWEYIREVAGSYHTTREFNAVRDILGPDGWDCTIGEAKRRWRA